MRDNISPEEKLLRLIRKEKRQDITLDRKPAVTTADLKPAPKHSIYSLIQKYFSFLYIRKIILVAFVASCLYLIVSLIYPWVGLWKIKLPRVVQEKITEAETKIEPKIEVKPYEFYQEGIGNRQIFSSISGQEIEKPAVGINADLIKDINLVGIISGENPVGIIEDKKTLKTYYVTKGQFIGEFQVEDIQEGKITISYRGQRFELYL